MSGPPARISPSSRGSAASMMSGSGGNSSGRPPAATTDCTYTEGNSTLGTSQTPQRACSS
jgi:hypothetical protein